jgi:hypothetical protein
MSTKVELKLKKKVSGKWDTLECKNEKVRRRSWNGETILMCACSRTMIACIKEICLIVPSLPVFHRVHEIVRRSLAKWAGFGE